MRAQPRLVPFTPTAADPEQLELRTVGRNDVLDHLLHGARAASRGLDRAHTLLVAPRGGGKTHVLTLFVHRLRGDQQFARSIAVVVIAEDAVDIASHLDLLVAVVEVLGTSTQADTARMLRRDGARAELERLVIGVLDGRPLVLVLENLERVFAELGTDGQQQLRAFVETSRAVMLVASTPALFRGVTRRTEPWFGSFAVERLSPWSVEEGAAFLSRVASERGDTALASLIASPIGRARLTAIEGLVGGLPRLWTILANCITVELLDELVPLVLTTLEELVPYYQARLNELPSGERKLVVALCRAETLGSETGRTVRELALAAGVPENSAPKLLRRLEEAGWVVATKPEGTDRRATWYEIREPLLRYHVAYRRQAGEPLALIVSFLRVWFSPSERRRHLAATMAGSDAESYVLESLRDAPTAADALHNAADPVDLLTGARGWFSTGVGTSAGVRSQTAAVVAEAVALVALGEANVVESTLATRLAQVAAPQRDVVGQTARAAIEAARTSATSSSGEVHLSARQATVQVGLDAAIGPSTQGRLEDEIAVAFIAHGWRGATGDQQGAYRELTTLLERAKTLDGQSAALRLAVEGQVAFFGCQIGKGPREIDRMQRVLAERRRFLGPDHPDTLTSRDNHAYQTSEAGDHAAARDLYATLINDSERVLGADHPTTLTSRHDHAHETAEAGDHAAARDLYATLINDSERVLGADHPNTLASRHEHAYQTAEAGDHAAARDLYTTLINDSERVLGADHPNTLSSRAVALAFIQSRAARRDAAVALLSLPCPEAIQAAVQRTLDGLFAEPAAHMLDDARERAALPHLLSSAPGPGLLALVARAGATPDIAAALVAAADDDPARVSALTTAIVLAAGDQHWIRSELGAWLDSWLTALAHCAGGDVPRSILGVVRRETNGDSTARPSLPPELRSIVPRVQVTADDA